VEEADEVHVDLETARLAQRSVQRMIEIGQPGGGE
jgi:quinolinate synthase